MSLGQQHFHPRCGICKKAGKPYNAITAVYWDGERMTVKCEVCGRVSRRKSRAARVHSMDAAAVKWLAINQEEKAE